jgi:thioredoxin 1
MDGEPTRAQIDGTPGPLLIEFGSATCGWCRAAQPLIHDALSAKPGLRHLKIEDGPGRPLGRSFGVKLWPTLVVLQDGHEVARVVRPQGIDEMNRVLARLSAVP